MFWSTNSFKSFCVHGWGAQIDVIFFCFFFRCMTYKTWTSIKRREFFSFDYNTFFLYIEIIDWKINNLISHKHLTSEFVNCPWRYNPRQMIIFHSGMAKYYRFIIACAPYRLPKFRETSTLVSSIFFFFSSRVQMCVAKTHGFCGLMQVVSVKLYERQWNSYVADEQKYNACKMATRPPVIIARRLPCGHSFFFVLFKSSFSSSLFPSQQALLSRAFAALLRCFPLL